MLANHLVNIIQLEAAVSPNKLAFKFVSDEDGTTNQLTYGVLHQRARSIAAHIQQIAATQSRVILLYPPGLEFIAAFFGCLYAGVIAVPAYPPSNERNTPRIMAIAKNAGASLALTTTSLHTKLQKFLPLPTWLATDTISFQLADDWLPPVINIEAPAFIQYTSGSTAEPRGVVLTHQNLYHNSKQISLAFGSTRDSIGVSWLPPYHDMGLIGSILQTLHEGASSILMSPAYFLQRPIRWLQAISDFRATHSGGPNFAFDLCAKKITAEQKAELDLSSWEVAYTGAEPVSADTLELFQSTFASCGFRAQTFHPCYGLAEATLMVSGGDKLHGVTSMDIDSDALSHGQLILWKSGNKKMKRIVGCGRVLLDQQVLIVNPQDSTLCPADRVGEIWVNGPSVAVGYWEQPEETRKTFKASLANDPSRHFLRTGDLGFLNDGELFITGRIKNLIILNGKNYYPHDIELTSYNSHPSLKHNGAAAFSIEMAGKEELVVVQELEFRQKPDHNQVVAAIREAIALNHEVQPFAVALLKPGTIARTSSGKIRHAQVKMDYQSGAISLLAEWRSPVPDTQSDIVRPACVSSETNRNVVEIEQWLIRRFAAKLRCTEAEVSRDQAFASLGLSSLEAVELTADLEKFIGFPVAPTLAWNYPTIFTLAKFLSSTGESVEASPTPSDIRNTPVSPNELATLSEGEFAQLLADEIAASKQRRSK